MPIDDLLLELNQATIEELTRQYVEIVREIANSMSTHISKSNIDIDISKKSLSLAFAEAAADLRIISMRRNTTLGISPAKIAGIVAFRLARFSPVHLCHAALEDDTLLRINELAALALALKTILHINITDISKKYVTMELQYNLVRRHMNQETLGMVFETLLATKNSV
ncbi:MAG: hypothetical protein J0649_09135 [Methylococcales bacterium]|jgi:hypothetical protein|nr:hypothetical protein [Methylococcales bacterium]